MSSAAMFIGTRQDVLLARFLQRAKGLPSARDLSDDELQDNLDQYLDALATLVAGRFDSRADERRREEIEEAHIATRLRQGYREDDVISEYLMLGRLLANSGEQVPGDQQPSPQEAARLFGQLQSAVQHVTNVFRSYSIEDRQREKRTMLRLELLSSDTLASRQPLGERFEALLRTLTDELPNAGAKLLLVEQARVGQQWSHAASVGAGGSILPPDDFLAQIGAAPEPVYWTVSNGAVRRYVGLRMWPRGKLLGAVIITLKDHGTMPERDRRFFEATTQHLASVLDRAQLFEELRRSESRYRMATRAVSDAVWDWDVRTDRLEWGRSFESSFGYSEAELVPSLSWWQERLHPADQERVVRSLDAAIHGTADRWEGEYRFRTGRGEWATVLDRGFIERDGVGEAIRMVGAMRDVTQLRRHEQEAKSRAEFEEHLVGIVSHDLRNPINTILLSTQVLMRRPNLDPDVTKVLGRIESSSARMRRMVSDILDLTKVRLHGGIPIEVRAADINAIVRTVIDEVRTTHPERRIEVRTLGNPEGEWDPDRLAQVVSNLVFNALAYSPPDSTVDVDVQSDDMVALSVHNAGPPIPALLQQQLFNPYRRGARSDASKTRGVGLGLFIVKQIVETHGGSVEVRSSEEQGTTFTVRLPRRAR